MYARYTVVLRDLLDNAMSKAAIDKALSEYPLYKPQKLYDLIPTREQLNERLLNHYKYREIGFETVGRFIDELRITMSEIMPRYNELFKTVETMAELPSPFDNVDVVEKYEETRTHSGETSNTSSSENNGTSSDSSESTAHGKHVFSGTPQDSLHIGSESIDSVDYADNAQWNEDKLSGSNSRTAKDTATGSATGTSESTDTVSHTYTKTGNQGVNTYAHDMNEFRTSIIDVVDDIINDSRVAELFMLVY